MVQVQTIPHIQHSLNYSVFDVFWIPSTAKFLSVGSKSNGKGIFQILELDSPNLNLVKDVEQESSVKCCSFGISSHFVTGDFAGKLKIFDVERPATAVHQYDAHSDIINTLDAIGGSSNSCGAKEIVTGSRDGSVKVWDPRQKDVPVANISAKTAEGLTDKRDCWAVAFGDSFNNAERAVCSGYENGDIKLFDLRKMSLKWETNCGKGICSVEFDGKDIRMNKLAVTTLEGGIYVYDMRLEDPTKSVKGKSTDTSEKSTVWTVKHLPQSRNVFMTGDGSGTVQTWSHNSPNKRIGKSSETSDELQMLSTTTLSRKPVHCIDWCPDRLGLAVCGALDQTIRVLITTNLNLY